MLAYVIHIGYGLMFCAFLARDILWLRGVLALAQFVIACYAWGMGLPAIAAWNLMFVSTNTAMAIRIARERRAVVLPPDLTALYRRHFAAMTEPEFLRFWRIGSRRVLQDAPLARTGQRPEWLSFVLTGTVTITRDEALVTRLGAGYFVAEMSLLTGDPANADADTMGEAEVMQWPTAALGDLRERNPAFWTKIQSVIGHDLIEKVHRGDSVPASAPA